MKNNKRSKNLATSSTGKLIIQAFIAGGLFAAFGILFGWIGKLFSDKPIEQPDVYLMKNGLSPLDLNNYMDEVLRNGHELLKHDQDIVHQINLIFLGICVFSIISATLYIIYLRKRLFPTTRILTFILILIPITTSIFFKIKVKSLLKSKTVIENIFNTEPPTRIVLNDLKDSVYFPSSIQSNFGYYIIENFDIYKTIAYLPDGEEINFKLINPNMNYGGSPPGRGDWIPLMENLSPKISYSLPKNYDFKGAIISISALINLRVTSDGGKIPVVNKKLDTSATFRVARDEEENFIVAYKKLTRKFSGFIYLALLSGVIIVALMLILNLYIDWRKVFNKIIEAFK